MTTHHIDPTSTISLCPDGPTSDEVIEYIHEIYPTYEYPPGQVESVLLLSKGWSLNQIRRVYGDISREDWFRKHGFVPIENQMRIARFGKYSVADGVNNILESLLVEAFHNHALIGNVLPSLEQREALHKHARFLLVYSINGRY